MDDVIKNIEAINNRITELQKERAEREFSANTHEQQAREDRLRMMEAKKEIQDLFTLLHNAKVQQRVATAEQAAMQAKAEAEATAAQAKADAAQAKSEQDAVLEKLKKQAAEYEQLIAKAQTPPVE